MSKFKKAKPEQAYLKMSMYGPPGAGKTFTALLWAEGLAQLTGKRIAYVDTERGTDFYAKEVPGRSVHPEAFDFDSIYTTSLLDVHEAVKDLNESEYGVIVIDSVSHLWDAAIAAYEGKKTKIDGIPMQAWGSIKKPYKSLIRWLMDSNYHVLILGRQKNIFEDDPETGNIRKTGVGMRAEGETEYEPHICARMESRKDAKDSTRSTVFALFEKDRTGILAGRTYANPNFEMLTPLLPILDGVQAHSEDPDEVAARDSELIDADKKKKQEKSEKSSKMMAEFNSKIYAATSLEELSLVASELKKQKRYMNDEHVDSLRINYEHRHKELADKNCPAEV